MRAAVLELSIALFVITPRPAPAAVDDDQLRLDGSTGYACFADNRRYHGVFGAAEVAYVFDAFWALRGGVQVSDHRGKGRAFRIHQVDLGVRYQLDVFEYVPWIELSPALYLSEGDGGPADLDGGLAVGLGFDWLMSPSWALGASTRYHRLLGEDRFPALLTIGVRLGYRWVVGDPFAP